MTPEEVMEIKGLVWLNRDDGTKIHSLDAQTLVANDVEYAKRLSLNPIGDKGAVLITNDTKSIATSIRDSLLNDPEAWEVSEHELQHVSGVRVWVGHGWLVLGINAPVKVTPSLIDRWRIWRAYKTWFRWFLCRRLTVKTK